MQDQVRDQHVLFPIHRGGAPSWAPSWLAESLSAFLDRVTAGGYPCHFATAAIARGLVWGTWLSAADRSRLGPALRASISGSIEAQSLIAFVEPESVLHTHSFYREQFWLTLQALHDEDMTAWPRSTPREPDDARWEFCFAGEPWFVFGAAPTHLRRRSRNLGPGLILAFQPRAVFDQLQINSPHGRELRNRIRVAISAMDDLAPHAALGAYGDPDNREWRQYFLPDDDRPVEGRCPLRIRSAAS